MEFTVEKLQKYLDSDLSASIRYILCGCIENDIYKEKIKTYINFFSNSLDLEKIEKAFIYLKSLVNKGIKNFNSYTDFNKQYSCMIQTRSYFCLLESTVENSTLTKNVVRELKKQFGKKYLNVVAKSDKNIKSVKTKNCPKFDNKIIDLYLLLKYWQNETHNMFLNLTNNVFNDFIQKLCDKHKFKNRFMQEEYAVDNFVNSKLSNKLISLDTIAKFIDLGFSQNVKDILGGKSYGLGVLKLLNMDVPYAYVVPIDYKISKKDLNLFNRNQKYSVRSSANIEDGTKFSFAGMFDTYLNVAKSDLLDNIDKVKNSVNNTRVRKYIEKFNLANPKMAVVIQNFIEPEKAGIWIGTGLHTGILEYTDGNGEKIVSGKVLPRREIWNKNNKQGRKRLMADNMPVGYSLLRLQKNIYDKFNAMPDFEWCIIDGNLKLLQFRRATAKIEIVEKPKINKNPNVIMGIPCSPGKFKGIAQFIRDPSQLCSLKKGNAILSVFTDPEWVQNLNNAGAIVTAMGGFLCHSAILSRELGIPCITGIGIPNLMRLKDKTIWLNGLLGKIVIKCIDKTAK